MIYVLYHKDCMDGKGAAYAAYLNFKDNAKYIEVAYNQPIPEMEDATEIYILDFSYPKDILLAMNEKTKVVVLDHHKSSEEALKDLEFAKFDMKKSGAKMAWDYFHPNTNPYSIIDHINYIQDRDLWKWELPDSKQYSLGAYSLVKSFKDLDKLSVKELIEAGYSIETYQNQLIESILKNSYLVINEIDNKEYKIAKVNSGVLQSELGNLLLSKYPECDFSYVYREDKDKMYVSLRSNDQKTDVSKIAKHYNGGGHRNASGFELNISGNR